MPIRKVCEVCGVEYYVKPSLVNIRHTCGKNECRYKRHSEIMKGHPHYGGAAPKGHPAWGGFETRFPKGKLPWNNGLNQSGMSGKKTSEETKKKISLARMGHLAWNKGLILPEEIRLKISAGLKGKKRPDVTLRFKGIKRPEVSKKMKGRKRPDMSEKFRNPEFAKHFFSTRRSRLTKPERAMIEIIEKNSLPFKYTGDGTKLIGNLNPDFTHSEGEKKVIEVFGRAFHDPEVAFAPVSWNRQEGGRIEAMNKEGYDCLILWDNEIEETKVLESINTFLGV